MPEKHRNKTYYELLGVSINATDDEIKRAYRDLSRIYHPDSNFYDDIIKTPLTDRDHEIFKLVTLAYNTLSDTAQRAEYDEVLRKQSLAVPGWNAHARSTSSSSGSGRPSDSFQQPRSDLSGLGAGPRRDSNHGIRAVDRQNFSDDLRPISERLRPHRSVFEWVMLFLGLGVPLITLIWALLYVLLLRK